jgi:deoxyadenosine/deoxycytidine kinase
MINKNKKSKMTIDDLAIVIAGSFNGLEERLTKKIGDVESGLKKEIGGVKDQLAGTNKRIDDFVETKVSKVVYKELENRFQKIEAKM